MKVSRKWIEWAHGPGAEDGQPLAMRLCDLAGAPGAGSIRVAEHYFDLYRGLASRCTRLWWMFGSAGNFQKGKSVFA